MFLILENNMKKIRRLILFVLIILGIGLFLPQNLSMPVQGATTSDYNHKSFWFYPWGKSITHKGVDIFAEKGTVIKSSVSGLVLYSGKIKYGGNVILVLGPKWRLHYFAHMDEINTSSFSWVNQKTLIGTVGDSGNAKGKPAHLHYSILTILPYFWRIDDSIQGWMKMFYLNPINYLKKS